MYPLLSLSTYPFWGISSNQPDKARARDGTGVGVGGEHVPGTFSTLALTCGGQLWTGYLYKGGVKRGGYMYWGP
eukprot:767374-Hanusia_phi.AAC.2